MARKLRIEYPGAIYHVINRGDRREAIFKDDHDRRRFLETLAEACTKTGWQVHAYCLMPNHFHLVAETPQPNLVSGMKWLLGTYTTRFNRRHRVVGHLFSGRYKALLVDGSARGYLRSVCDYVHLNPVRAELINSDEPLRSFVWSSFSSYLGHPSRRAAWLRVDRVLGEHGIPHDTAAGRRRFELRLENRRREGTTEEEWKRIRRGWCLGDEVFRRELLAQMNGRIGDHHYGEERRATAEERAEQIVREGLAKAGWTEKDLKSRPKGDPVKMLLATRLRRETTLTMKWVAHRLQMGSWKYLGRRLHEQRKTQELKANVAR